MDSVLPGRTGGAKLEGGLANGTAEDLDGFKPEMEAKCLLYCSKSFVKSAEGLRSSNLFAESTKLLFNPLILRLKSSEESATTGEEAGWPKGLVGKPANKFPNYMRSKNTIKMDVDSKIFPTEVAGLAFIVPRLFGFEIL